jgi:hypothetical protein
VADREPKTVVVLGCGKEKRALAELETCPIVDLYTGPLYQARLAFARRLGGPHWIVSAFHGAKRPDFQAITYDRELAKQDRRVRDWFADFVRNELLADTQPGDRIIALASKPYVIGWARRLENEGRIVELPLEGLQMGEQRAFLARMERLPTWLNADRAAEVTEHAAGSAMLPTRGLVETFIEHGVKVTEDPTKYSWLAMSPWKGPDRG